MKTSLFLFLIFLSTGLQAQEYWDRKDFEIGNRGIDKTWKEIGFGWQTESNFNLPDGSFLHLRSDVQKKQIDMLAVISREQRNKIQRKVDLGSPLQTPQKEKKLFEVRAEAGLRDENDIFSNPFYPQRYFNNTFNQNYGLRRYNSSRYINYY